LQWIVTKNRGGDGGRNITRGRERSRFTFFVDFVTLVSEEKIWGNIMYRVSKVLNNNGVIAINMEENIEYVLLGKGIGFGKKISERFEAPDGCARCSLREDTERGSAKELAKSIAPEYLEIANAILVEAEEKFGRIDRRILFPLADHISFAVERIRHGEQISNPLTEDIRALFGSEYQVASKLKEILKERLSVEIDSHEIGYVALHIHSAIEDENVSMAMQMARAVRECVKILEQETGKQIDVRSLSYNRLMNHVKYMIIRAIKKESIKLDLNDYMQQNHPEAFRLGRLVCQDIEKECAIRLEKMEVGYLAMHIERVYSGISE